LWTVVPSINNRYVQGDPKWFIIVLKNIGLVRGLYYTSTFFHRHLLFWIIRYLTCVRCACVCIITPSQWATGLRNGRTTYYNHVLSSSQQPLVDFGTATPYLHQPRSHESCFYRARTIRRRCHLQTLFHGR